MNRNQYYTLNSNCRACGSMRLKVVYNTEPIPVAGIYYNNAEEPTDIRAPMTLAVCEECSLIQLLETISPEIYDDYSFSGSKIDTYINHLKNISELLISKWGIKNKDVFEVGASDGLLLRYLSEFGNNRAAGIEPSGKLCRAAKEFDVEVKQGYFNKRYISQRAIGKYDCVIIRHVLEHIDNLHDMVGSLADILKDDGILVVEVPNVEDIIEKNLFSNIFHEHLNYFSKYSMNRLLSQYGLQNIYSESVDVHGGSVLLIYRFGKCGETYGKNIGYSLLEEFAKRIDRYYFSINDRIISLMNDGKKVHGYGASHRTFILLGNAGLNVSQIPIIYDSNPFLANRYLNGLHSFILSAENIMIHKPDAIVIFATSYEDEITIDLQKKYGYEKEILSLKARHP